MTERVFNFSPGPSMLPLPVLETVKSELLNYRDTGISIVEHSHRGKAYGEVHETAGSLVRELLGVPDTHDVLWMQGGATGQFALVPMNFLSDGGTADYVVTGTWGEKALAEAKLIGTARVAADTSEGEGKLKSYTRVPQQEEMRFSSDAKYAHMTTNNTIFGTQFHRMPETSGVPLVADMSSDIFSRPVDVSKFGLIYAGAQKNLGPAGITLVVVRKDLVEQGSTKIPKIFRYSTLAAADSLQNTIPTFAVYCVKLVLEWLKEQGGVASISAKNDEKAAMLYGLVDEMSDFYRAPVEKASRSKMNAVFRLPSEELEASFVAEADKLGLVNLKGHRSVGGVRVSMYNAMPVEGVAKLCDFMKQFAARA